MASSSSAVSASPARIGRRSSSVAASTGAAQRLAARSADASTSWARRKSSTASWANARAVAKCSEPEASTSGKRTARGVEKVVGIAARA